MTERIIRAGDPPLAVRVLECGAPAGVPLVFVQGGLGEAIGWASLLAELREFRCLTLDRPGGGLSDGVDFLAIDVRRLAVDVLAALLDAVEVERAAFVANSMGAWWTLQLATERAARVSRLALLGCPALLLDSTAPLPMRLMSIPVLGGAMVKLMVPSSATKAREVPGFLGHPKDVGRRWHEVEASAHHRFGQLPNFQRSWRTLLRRFLRPWGSNRAMAISAAQLKRVAAPTLFLWGADDPFGGPEVGRAAVEAMPDARLEVVGRGHLPWWDEPAECARWIRELIARPATQVG